MEVKIKDSKGMIDATIEMVDGVMVVSPKEVKFEPKDGDVCYSSNCIYIFKGVRPSGACKDESAIVCHCCYNGEYLTAIEGVGVGYISRNQRYATEEEKKRLFDKLAEEGWEWKADTKEIVKVKWKPCYHEKYYRPSMYSCAFKVVELYWENDDVGMSYYNKDWIFRNEQECQELCNRLNEAINSVKP